MAGMTFAHGARPQAATRVAGARSDVFSVIRRVSVAPLLAGLLLATGAHADESRWHVDFFDDFDTFNPDNWQDQMLWVNDEDQCYVPDNQHNTREVSDGTLKLRVVNIGEDRPCSNLSKKGEKHPDTRYVAARIASKNRKEFSRGRWTARLKVHDNGQAGMFPAWWLLGARNNESPVQEADETVCWPMPGSGEIDIFEHYGSNGVGHYAARMIIHPGHCGEGDWETLQKVLDADLGEFHEYSVEWLENDLVFRLDGLEVHRISGRGDDISEPMFAILNFAKITSDPMEGEWVMEVDWVKHEHRR
jgi:beta-glucanase (GH16 family)